MSEEKIALVTGASRGIGLAVAEKLLAEGRKLVVSARDEADFSALCARFPDRVRAVSADLTQPGAQEALWAAAESQFGRVDELVYSAGVVRYAPLSEISESDLRTQLELNFIAPFRLMQRAGVAMQHAGQGAIVLLASTLGERPVALTAAYAASKAALINLAKTSALELAPRVRVNVVSPGIVDTDMVRVSRMGMPLDAASMDAHLASLAKQHPLGRLGRAEEVADAVLFALNATWMTGSVLTLDGGIKLS